MRSRAMCVSKRRGRGEPPTFYASINGKIEQRRRKRKNNVAPKESQFEEGGGKVRINVKISGEREIIMEYT